jgi:hypothetical protein
MVLCHVTADEDPSAQLCRTFAERGACPYGARCRFIHNYIPPISSPAAASAPAPSLEQYSISGALHMPQQDLFQQASLGCVSSLLGTPFSMALPSAISQAMPECGGALGQLGAALGAGSNGAASVIFPAHAPPR